VTAFFCPVCYAAVQLMDVQPETQSIRCRVCSAEHSTNHLLDESGNRADLLKRRRKKVSRQKSKRIQVHEDGSDLVVTYKWPVISAVSAAVFGVGWTGMSIFFMSVVAGRSESGTAPLWFAALLLSISIITFVSAAYLFFNSTTYRISQQRLVVTHDPLPWPGKTLDLDLDNVEQLYVKQHISKPAEGGEPSVSYSLNTITHSGRHTQIEDRLPLDVALCLAQEIEQWLQADQNSHHPETRLDADQNAEQRLLMDDRAAQEEHVESKQKES
jgi:hypothetical protein